jgi:hypothetical protein
VEEKSPISRLKSEIHPDLDSLYVDKIDVEKLIFKLFVCDYELLHCGFLSEIKSSEFLRVC